MKTNDGARPRGAWWRLGAASILAAALAGCATGGTPLASLATVGGPPRGMARIVVVRPPQTTMVARYAGYQIKLDGEELGDLGADTFAYLDRPAGSHQLSADISGNPGVTRRDFTTAPGRTYYFTATLNAKMNDLAAVSMVSPVGALIAAAATYDDRQGPVDLTPTSEAEARTAIAAARAVGQ